MDKLERLEYEKLKKCEKCIFNLYCSKTTCNRPLTKEDLKLDRIQR